MAVLSMTTRGVRDDHETGSVDSRIRWNFVRLGELVDRDVHAGVGGELAAAPISQSIFEAEPGELGHEAEFAGPDVAAWCPVDPGCSSIIQDCSGSDVVRDDLLAEGAVGIGQQLAWLAGFDCALMLRS